VDLAALTDRDGTDLFTALFSESQARALVSVPAATEEALLALAAQHGVPALRLGSTGGGELGIAGLEPLGIGTLRELREGTLPRYFG